MYTRPRAFVLRAGIVIRHERRWLLYFDYCMRRWRRPSVLFTIVLLMALAF